MFSFVGDTVLDPFMGTASTNIAAAKWGRNSIGIEVDEEVLCACGKTASPGDRRAIRDSYDFHGHTGSGAVRRSWRRQRG